MGLYSEPIHVGSDPRVVRKSFDGADGSDSGAFVVNVLHHDVLHVLSGDRLKHENSTLS